MFIVRCPDQQLYAVAVKDSLTIEGRLRIAESLNSQEKKIKWARNHSWDEHIKRLKAERIASQSLMDSERPL